MQKKSENPEKLRIRSSISFEVPPFQTFHRPPQIPSNNPAKTSVEILKTSSTEKNIFYAKAN